ncbi:uncharacterized protein LOC112183741 [Rosa chinensis]|uniref:uncharacterized protein LOC112183741 n=1 Tax=Rosa chinensis TaxID=74649 RepID=UPI000D093298|nr:uncharacterized protein LOC112183741 [Rosa chinensis]
MRLPKYDLGIGAVSYQATAMGEPPPACPWSFLQPFSDTRSPSSTSEQRIHKAKTFASIVAGSEETQVPISQLPAPTIRGDTVYVKINERIYQEQSAACRNNLIGRLLLRKGTIPLKTETLKASLHTLWRPLGPWRLVPIGKRYFDIHFNSEADMRKVWGGGTCTLESGIFRLSQWKPDFRPGDVLPQTHAQIWVRISGLSQEYWHQQHILEIARGVGTPLQLDAATKKQRYGYYARVLVDVDMLGALPTSIMEIKSKDIPAKRKEVGQEYRIKNKLQETHVQEASFSNAHAINDIDGNVVTLNAIEQPLAGDQALHSGNDQVASPNETSIQAPIQSDVVVDLVNTILEEAAADVMEEQAQRVMEENNSNLASNDASDASDTDISDSPTRTWGDIFEEERVEGLIREAPSSAPPSLGPPPGFVKSHVASEIAAVARFVNGEDIDGFIPASLNLRLISVNDRGTLLPNIWLLGSLHISSPTLVFSADQHITIQITLEGTLTQLSCVYAATTALKRRKLWSDLLLLRQQTTIPWMAIGDFNAVLGAHEAMNGAFFTWSKGRGRKHLERRLDRSLCDDGWFEAWPFTNCIALPRVVSDHNGLLFSAGKFVPGGPKPFRFQSMWLLHSSFKELVANCWSTTRPAGCPMYVTLQKLKALKSCLKQWNNTVFGNVHRNLELARAKLTAIQQDIASNGSTDINFEAEVLAKADVLNAVKHQEAFWRDRARVKWFTEGNKCSKFFHAYARNKARRSSMHCLQVGGNLLTDPQDIANHVVEFYKSLYASDVAPSGVVDFCKVIPSLVSEDDNSVLVSIPTAEEIRRVVFFMDPSSSPGPDGFPGSFYQSCWDIVGNDVIGFVQFFFQQYWLYPNANSNFIVLIPKTEGANMISQFRLIALANFLFKIIPKIMADRLGPIASRIISAHQTAFLKGSRIADCIGLVSEGFNLLDRKIYGEEYGAASGQIVNKEKSTFYTGDNYSHRRRVIKRLLGFKLGTTPLTYLGVPIFKGKPRRIHLQATADKAKSRLVGWQGKLLSMAGRVQLVHDVFQSLLIHSFSVYLWPSSLLKHLSTCARNFIWYGDLSKRKLVIVSWRQVCVPKKEGGLGLRDLKSLNLAALISLSWSTLTSGSIWSSYASQRFSICCNMKYRYFRSSVWHGLKTALPFIFHNSKWLIGDGKLVNLWMDKWLNAPLIVKLQAPNFPKRLMSTVENFITNQQWTLPNEFSISFPVLAAEILQIPLSIEPENDVLIWEPSSSGSFSFSDGYHLVRQSFSEDEWVSKVWHSFIPPRLSLLAWRLSYDKLPTDVQLQKRGIPTVSVCQLCTFGYIEDSTHLFVTCSFAQHVWQWLACCFGTFLLISGTIGGLFTSIIGKSFSPQLKNIWLASCLYALMAIWKARNKLRFEYKRPSLMRIFSSLKAWLRFAAPYMPGYSNGLVNTQLLVGLGIQPIPKNRVAPRLVLWHPPIFPWIKLNTDGLAKGNPGPAACGGVFRDTHGHYISGYRQGLGHKSAFYAELMGVIIGIEYAFQYGW